MSNTFFFSLKHPDGFWGCQSRPLFFFVDLKWWGEGGRGGGIQPTTHFHLVARLKIRWRYTSMLLVCLHSVYRYTFILFTLPK